MVSAKGSCFTFVVLGLFVLSISAATQTQQKKSRIGREVAIPRHLQDDHLIVVV